MRYLLLFVVFLSIPVYAEAPKVLTNALDAYIDKGKSALIPTLLKGSPLEGDKGLIGQENMIAQIEAYYGKPESWEILASCELTDRIKITYYVMYHETGPTYGHLHSFKKKNGDEIATSFLFNTEAKAILPFIPIKRDEICGGHES